MILLVCRYLRQTTAETSAPDSACRVGDGFPRLMRQTASERKIGATNNENEH